MTKNKRFPELFDFGDALYFTRCKNNFVSRVSWVESENVLGYNVSDNKLEVRSIENGIFVFSDYVPTQEDVLADDWFVFDSSSSFKKNIELLF